MKKLTLGTAALVAMLAGPAIAADLPTKAPVYKAPVVGPLVTWTGCYLGGNIGGGWASKDYSAPTSGTSFGSHTASGFVGGGQLGCDYQAGSWLFGIQGMFDWSNMRGDHFNQIAETESTRISWFSTLTGRIGYAVQPATLLYVKGGAAWVRDKHAETFAGALTGSAEVTRRGWTVGGGLEYLFAPNWSLFAEYDFMAFGHDTVFFAVPSTGFRWRIEQDVQVVLVGINYRFGGPVVARY